MTEQNKKIAELARKFGIVSEKTLQETLKKAYYEGTALVTDEEYDELFGDKDYVGYTPDENGPWQVLPHKIAMGSLNKLKTWQQAEDWLKDKGDVIWEPKLDGLSIELVYEKGTLTHAILRGGGDKGEDILKNAEKFAGVPKYLMLAPDYVSVRGEVIISKTNFEVLNKESNEAYSNRRNCISGICRRYDGAYSGLLGFYAYDIIEQTNNEDKKYTSETEKLVTLYNYNFRLPFAYNVLTEKQYNDYGDIRDSAESFQMDGLVIKTLDMKHQIALKFEPKGEQTKVTHYTWDVGSTGKLVPTIWFETVNVGGSNLSKAAIGSYQGYIDLGATIGSKVEVRKMGDVIPKVTRVIEQNKDLAMEIPDVCPVCGSSLEHKGTDLYCVNPNCLVKQEMKCCSVYWAICMKGITDTWVKALMKSGIIQKCYDVPLVKAEDIANIEGYSFNKAEKMIAHFKGRYAKIINENDIATLLWMLPIPTVKGKALEDIIKLFNTLQDFKSWLQNFGDNQKQLTDLIGNSKGTKAFEYFKDNKEDILKLIDNMERITNE